MDITIEFIRDRITQWAISKKEVQRVFLFGSRARKEDRPGSDVDIALLVTDLNGESADTRYYWNRRYWKEELGSALERPVSIVRLVDNGRTDIQDSIARDGILLYEKTAVDVP